MKILYIILLLTAALSSAAIAQVLPFPLDTLLYDDHFNYRAMTAYDAAGTLHIVHTRQFDTQSATREIYYWNDAGGTFQSLQLTNNAVDDNYATLDFDAAGNVHICFEARDAANLFQVYYTNNIGGSFIDPPVQITSGGLNKATPFMAVNDSVAHFVYYTFVTGTDNVYYKNYNYAAAILGSEVTLGPGEASSENDAQVDTDRQGKVHIVFRGNNLGDGVLRYFSDVGGTLQEVPTGVGVFVEYPALVIAPDDVLHIVYRDLNDRRLYTLNNAGGSFSAPLAIVPPNSGRPSFYRNIAADSTGRLYVTYQNSISSAPRGFFLVHGKDGNFSDPQLVFEDTTGAYVTRVSCSVAARGDGEAAVVFSPGGLRGGNVVADIFLKRGELFAPPLAAQITVAPDSLDFGMVTVDSSAIRLVTISNPGSATLVIDTLFSDHPAFSIASGDTIFLEPDSSYSLAVTFAPPSVGPYQAQLTLQSNAANQPLAIIPLSGSGEPALGLADGEQRPETFELLPNYPNPFNPSTTIPFRLPRAGNVELTIFNQLGETARILLQGPKTAGTHQVTWDGKDAAGRIQASGIYFYQLKVEGIARQARKMLLIK
ncbi:MAG: choice-of-anchor D domain-containing protein [Calditrichaeota bacterium]|nr:choice-of-anchor D domain-containing protein [Calditrichota bacterium]MCB9089606.1 choice-of-anchor D domain-containing protein [Calditrichia bacterium]